MWLAIETAGAACSVALIARYALVDERHAVVGRGHAEALLPMIEALLRGRATPAAVHVDCGPGSFTGVRVGLAAARALGLAWDVPVHGFSSTALAAAGAFARHPAADRLTVALTGGHGELFVESFARNSLGETPAPRSLPPAEAAAWTDAALIVGSGAAALVAARGTGEVDGSAPHAGDVRLLGPAGRDLPPQALYGRPPDAKAALPKPALS